MGKNNTPATGGAMAGARGNQHICSYASDQTKTQAPPPPFRRWSVSATLLVEVLA